MRIVILGAGQVGASVAEALASEANDITIVDQSRPALATSPTASTCAPWSATAPCPRC
jgi:Trk K+ transport system NAD-binding subunit